MKAGANRLVFQHAMDHALRFRSQVADRAQGPLRGFHDSLKAFSEPLPETGSAGVDVIDGLVEKAEPGLNCPTGPRFFGWVMGGSHPVGVAADWLTSAWGQNAGNHHASPSAAAAEAVAAHWLLELLDLPHRSSVGFVTGATMANFVCIAAARGEVLRRAGWDVEAKGLFGAPPIHVLIGDDAHATVFSALQFLGLGHDRVIRIATDGQGRMLPAAFAAAAGNVTGPAIAVMQAGQINTGAFDNFTELMPLARRAGAWVHVDGAFGLWAKACPPRAHLAEAVEQADSWATDGHKWLNVPYDSGYAFVADPEPHRRSMTHRAAYLAHAADARDQVDWNPEHSRRARGFATYAALRELGRAGVADLVERCCRHALAITSGIGELRGAETVSLPRLNQGLVRFPDPRPNATPEDHDRHTAAVIERIQRGGEAFFGSTVWRRQRLMRVSVCNWRTNENDVRRAVEAVRLALAPTD